jgi:hypothetical protein
MIALARCVACIKVLQLVGHILNLCLIDVAQAAVLIRNSFDVMKSLYNLIEGSAKRHTVSEDIPK